MKLRCQAVERLVAIVMGDEDSLETHLQEGVQAVERERESGSVSRGVMYTVKSNKGSYIDPAAW